MLWKRASVAKTVRVEEIARNVEAAGGNFRKFVLIAPRIYSSSFYRFPIHHCCVKGI